jgi:hypothetical protein
MSGTNTGDKPPQAGLVDMGDIQFYNDPSTPTPTFTLAQDLTKYPGAFSEIVLNVTWAQLQPNPGVALDTSFIQQATSEVAAYNTQFGTDLGIKLRVWGGYTAPDWAKAIDGPPITVTGAGTVDPTKDQTETIGRFWSADYLDAWSSFQAQLAAAYDNSPMIRGISNTAGAAATDEPFVPLHPDQVGDLQSGGYTDAAEERTLRNAIADYSSWSTTPLDYTMNLFHQEDTGTVVSDPNFTLAVLQLATNSSRAVQAGNHALNNPWPQADSFVYAQMAADAALDPNTVPGSYQTASPVVLRQGQTVGNPDFNWGSAIAQGAAANAGDIELWDGPGTTGFTGLSLTAVDQLGGTLAAGIAPVTGAPDDRAALGFVAPGLVSGAPGNIALTGVDAVLLASKSVQTTYTVTVTSTGGNTLEVANFPNFVNSIVIDHTSDTTINISGSSLAEINTVLASLTDTLQSGHDVLNLTATDNSGDTASRSIGILVSTDGVAPLSVAGGPQDVVSAATATTTFTWTGGGSDSAFTDAGNWTPAGVPSGTLDTALFSATPSLVTVSGDGTPGTMVVDAIVVPGGDTTITIGTGITLGTGDLDIADQHGSSGELLLGGVNTTLSVAGDLNIGGSAGGNGGDGVLLANVAPGDQSTATLTVGGTVHVWGHGTARLAGNLSAAAIRTDPGGTISADGTLSVSAAGPIANNGAIEAVTDQTAGLQILTLGTAVAGTGQLEIDPGATLILADAVNSGQTIDFLPPSAAQFANDPYSPSTLVLESLFGVQGTVTGFTFADSLVLYGINGASATIAPPGTLSILNASGGTLYSIAVPGTAGDLMPVTTDGTIVTSSGTIDTTTVNFVAKGRGQLPSVSVPPALQGAQGIPVLVPNIVPLTPLPASPGNNTTVIVTLIAGTGTLAAGNDFGNATIEQIDAQTLVVTGTLGAVERSLQSLTYQGSAAGSDTIQVSVSDYDGQSAPMTIDVTNAADTAVPTFTWAITTSGSFSDNANWNVGSNPAGTPPGGANVADFGAGVYTVTGDGAVGQINVSGTVTFTGQDVAQGTPLIGPAIVVDHGGALTLAGGAVLTSPQSATIGQDRQGLLTLMQGALSLTGAANTDALIIGQGANADGTVLDFEQITALGTVVVGDNGSGTLRLLGASAMVSDGGADIGRGAAGGIGVAVVDGGFWTNAGQLTVGDSGHGSLLIGGAVNGITGQVTAFDATIGAQTGANGSVTLASGDLLVANATAMASTLSVGLAGSGTLAVEGNGNVTVGAAQIELTGTSSVTNVGTLSIGGAAGGSGLLTISGDASVLVNGNALVGGGAGSADVVVGQSATDTALLAMSGTLAIGKSGQVSLGGVHDTIRASAITIGTDDLLSGAGTISGDGGGNNTVRLTNIVNDGTIEATGGSLLVYGSVVGTGEITVETGATITMQATVGAGQTMAFSPTAHAVLNDVSAFAGTITGFAKGNILDLASTAATTATWSPGTLAIVTAAGTIDLNIAGSYAPNEFVVQSDGLGGTEVELACFAAGTRILTPSGPVVVEALSPGDRVLTMEGECLPIRWIGRRRVDCRRHPYPRAISPVRIKAHAFRPGCPERDLFLSPDHAIYHDGVLIPVKYLLNGTTLRQMRAAMVDYFHLELSRHDVVLAEGLPSETFLDSGNRAAFGNAPGAVQLHPDFSRADTSLSWDARGYAPLCVVGEQVERLREHLAAQVRRLRSDGRRRQSMVRR